MGCCNAPVYRGLPPYAMFTQFTPALPQFYTQVPTMEQGFKELCKQFVKMVCYSDTLAEAINGNAEAIEELKEQFQKFIDGEYDDYYKDLISKWIEDNFEALISEGIRQVFFGLTDDGYFCAYIPESWSEISFDTGAVFGRSDYGRLILRFEPDDAMGVIDNTYGSNSSFSNAELSAANRSLANVIETLVSDVEINTRRTDVTYAAEFTNLDEVVSNGNF